MNQNGGLGDEGGGVKLDEGTLCHSMLNITPADFRWPLQESAIKKIYAKGPVTFMTACLYWVCLSFSNRLFF